MLVATNNQARWKITCCYRQHDPTSTWPLSVEGIVRLLSPKRAAADRGRQAPGKIVQDPSIGVSNVFVDASRDLVSIEPMNEKEW